MPYTAITDSQERDLNKENPSNKKFTLGTYLKGLAAAVASLVGVETLTNKTLTTPVIASIYQDAGKTKLMTLPNTASDTLVGLVATQALTNKTLTAPVISAPDIIASFETHTYAGAAADWVLSEAEAKNLFLYVTNANGAVNAVVPVTSMKPHIFVNTSGQALTVKTPAGTGIVIANTKTAMVMSDGVNVARITPDA